MSFSKLQIDVITSPPKVELCQTIRKSKFKSNLLRGKSKAKEDLIYMLEINFLPTFDKYPDVRGLYEIYFEGQKNLHEDESLVLRARQTAAWSSVITCRSLVFHLSLLFW